MLDVKMDPDELLKCAWSHVLQPVNGCVDVLIWEIVSKQWSWEGFFPKKKKKYLTGSLPIKNLNLTDGKL